MATWEWWSVDGWIPYDAKANKKISKGSLKKKPSVEITLANGTVYVIDLINLRQYLKTVPSRTRKVRFNDGSLSRVAPKVIHTHTHTNTVVAAPSPVPAPSMVIQTAPAPVAPVQVVQQPIQTMQPMQTTFQGAPAQPAYQTMPQQQVMATPAPMYHQQVQPQFSQPSYQQQPQMASYQQYSPQPQQHQQQQYVGSSYQQYQQQPQYDQQQQSAYAGYPPSY